MAVNQAEAWFDLKRPVNRNVRDDDGKIAERILVRPESRKLARKIMSHPFARNRRPRYKNIGMVVEQRQVAFAKADKATSLTRRFGERFPRLRAVRARPNGSRDGGVPPDPRLKNPYFAAFLAEARSTGGILELARAA
jgi:hypothetical protein